MSEDNQPQEDNIKKTGQTMFILGWVCVAGLFYLFFDNHLAKEHNPNQSPASYVSADQKPTVHLKRNKMGHYVTSGLLNGVPAVFLLDTGATVVSIPAHLQSKFGLRGAGYSQVSTANGIVQTQNTSIDNISIGNIQVQNLRAHLNPGMTGEEILLGMSMLKHLHFTQQGDELILSLP